MKYIKKFEDSEQTNKYKKYLVIKSHNSVSDIYYILEVVRYERLNDSNLPPYIHCNKLYTYQLSSDKLKKNKEQNYNMSFDKVDKQLMYQTDDLKSALDVINSLKNVNIYNI